MTAELDKRSHSIWILAIHKRKVKQMLKLQDTVRERLCVSKIYVLFYCSD